MLQLQRASAGSGKTFTLAKKFIWYLIAIKDRDRGGKWRLRTPRETADGLQRILAITFTNKATNEMKQRIVEKLADLSRADSDRPLTPEERKKITYLDDFAADLDVDPQDIGRVAKEALSVLLNDYSDFKVSTIDSFFQTVLRTFAYESNLNDSYQVEIDNDYVAAAAVNATLNDLDAFDGGAEARYWISRLMEEESEKGTKNWNVFQKSTSDTSIYTRLLDSVKRLESEDFKTVREEIDEYFIASDSDDPLRRAYLAAIDAIRRPAEHELNVAKKAGAKLKRLFKKNGLDPKETGLNHMAGHLDKLPGFTVDTPTSKLFAPIDMTKKTSVFKTTGKKKVPVASCPDDGEMYALACEMYEAFSDFVSRINSPGWLHWKVYAPQIPYLGLIGVTRMMMNEYLEANNTIQLGETNSMLRRIIGKDDAPFIYERLGGRLNHFLIDEFQDTSRLQWENLLPLLHESDGRGEDNLIIGDAKQSIYRFRNADPSLITDDVPKEFPNLLAAGMSKEENTNWRSDRIIVEFNNYFFYTLMRRVSEVAQGVIDFENLYANVAQYPKHQEDAGYVEVNFLEAPDTRVDDRGRIRKLTSNEKNDLMREEALSRLGPLISSLLERGYRQSDIAILVRVNSLAKEVIDTLVKYNNSPDVKRPVEFISEESLLVSSSEAVGIIIGVLGKMADGSTSAGDEADDAHSTRWSDIQCDFTFYAMRHPDLTPADQVRGFLNESTPEDAVNTMLRSMQTVALPALVEAITENFVPEDMRRSQAVFIAALQDIVLEYTDSHPSDISSFIDWWRTKGVSRSISSPEGTDALQIMTIHKSKGLEFKCVIIPFDDTSITPQKKSEWKWVRPAQEFIELGFPPFVPVATEPALKETIHSDVYARYFDLASMDMLNAYYVAFTRAVSELYVFTRKPTGKSNKQSVTLGSCLYEFFTPEFAEEEEQAILPPYTLPPGSGEWNEDMTRLTVGRLPEVEIRNDAEESGARIIEEYHVDSSPSVLQYVEIDDTSADTRMPDTEDTDPRSEGNLLHSVMAMVKVPSDLHRALLYHKMRGLITSKEVAEWEPFLGEAIADPRVSEWFAPGWKVMTERDIIFPGMKNRRPDRILMTPDKRLGIVIDYKFGEIPSGKSHVKQVEQYLRDFHEVTGIRNVTGYIWYVRKGEIVRVFGDFAPNY